MDQQRNVASRSSARRPPCCGAALGPRRLGAARRVGAAPSYVVQRLALPPDQLRPGRHRHPRLPEDHGRQGRPLDAVRHPAAAEVVATATPATSRRPTTCRPTRRSTTTRSPTPTSRCSTARCTKERAGALRPDDHRLQPGRHVRRRSHPARAARPSPASSPASASSRSTRSSSRRRSPARRPASRTRRSIASSTSRARSGSS